MDELLDTDQLETTLYALLFNHEARQSILDASSRLPDFLSSIDKTELHSVTRKVAKNLLYGNSASLGGLSASFPKSLELVGVAHHESIVTEFMAADVFALATDIERTGSANCCVEEAFYLFLTAHPLFQSAELQALIKFEVYKAVLSIYVHNRTPAFAPLQLDIRRHANTPYALVEFDYEFVRALFPTKRVAKRENTLSVLFAATSRGLLLGPLSDPSSVLSYLS